MTDLVSFLTSEEIVMVYVIVGCAGFLSLFLYIANKTYAHRRQKNNTQELKRLVEQVQEKSALDTILEEKVEPKEVTVVAVEEKKEEPFVLPEVQPVEPVVMPKEEIVAIEEEPKSENIENIEYKDIEPDKTEAQAELEKLAEELRRAQETVEAIELTEFEAEQEENAIISLEELLSKGNDLYERNEVTQYEDEGNEPISIQDLEERMQKNKEIEVIEMIEDVSTTTPEIISTTADETQIVAENTVHVEVEKPSTAYQTKSTFKSSPIISPIFGIEKEKAENPMDLELENTANYEKLDEEIRKTNEFVMTLKELQKNLD